MREMDGVKYTVEGTVLRGKGMGRRLGFATANLSIEDAPGIPYGVYAAEALLDGIWHKAVVNVGQHPTLPEGVPTVEIHLLDVEDDFYGKRLVVHLKRFLRGERRFETVEALRAQVRQDIASVRDGE